MRCGINQGQLLIKEFSRVKCHFKFDWVRVDFCLSLQDTKFNKCSGPKVTPCGTPVDIYRNDFYT